MKPTLVLIICMSLSTSFAQETMTTNSEEHFPKNQISFDFLSPLYGKASVSYERILAKGHVGLELPFSYRVARANIGLNSKWETGLEAKIYPTGQGKIKYYFGLEGKYGQRDGVSACPTCFNYEILPYYIATDYLGVYAKNGVAFNPYKHLGFNAALGLGIYKELSSYSYQQWNENGYFEFGVNYRF